MRNQAFHSPRNNLQLEDILKKCQYELIWPSAKVHPKSRPRKSRKNPKMSSQDLHAAPATVDVKVQAQKVSFACEVYKESTVPDQGEL